MAACGIVRSMTRLVNTVSTVTITTVAVLGNSAMCNVFAVGDVTVIVAVALLLECLLGAADW